MDTVASDSPDQRSVGHTRPRLSPGKPTPVRLPKPKAVMERWYRSLPRVSPTFTAPTFEECWRTSEKVSHPYFFQSWMTWLATVIRPLSP